MPTIEIAIVDDRIVLNVAIAAKRQDLAEHGFRAILDTGAQKTCISAEVVAKTRPEVVTETQLEDANGTKQWTNVLRVHVRVLLGLTASQATEHPGHDILAPQLLAPIAECDVLLGMDIISRWHVTLHNGLCAIKL